MPNNVDTIVVSPARVLYSPVGTSLPADTLAPGGTWPTGWIELGYTAEPLKSSYTFDTIDHFVEQHLAKVGSNKSKEALMLETVMAEFTATNLNLAWDGSVTPGTNSDEFDIGDYRFLTKRQWGFEGDHVDGDGNYIAIRAFVWVATAVTGGELVLSKSATTGIPLKVDAFADTTRTVGNRLMKIQICKA